MSTIDRMIKDGTFETLSKREKLQITRQRAKLEKNLGSIQDLTRLPAALFVVDIMKEHIAIKEAQRLNIPVFAMVDTNSNPNEADFIIPANDDSSESINLILSYLADDIKAGLQERKAEAVANEDENGDDENAPKRERKGKVARKVSTKEDQEAINAAVASKYVKDTEE